MSKRGQITVFIIAGILIVIVASIVFFTVFNVNSTDKLASSTGITESDSIKSLVQDCVDNAAEQSIILLGQQGGHVYLPEKRIELEDYSIVYDYYEGQNLLPTKEQIEQDLAKYVSESVIDCIDKGKKDFHSDLEFGEIMTNAQINEKDVYFEVTYPIIIKYFDKAEELNDKFKAKVNVRLAHILNASSTIIESVTQDPNWINFGLLAALDVKTDVLNYGDSTIYVIEDSKSQINNKNYTFIFANKFKENMQPDLFTFDTYEITPGQRLIIKARAIDPEGDKITYSSGSDNVLKTDKDTGILQFYTPTNPDNTPIPGSYTFTIRATDSQGNYDVEKLIIKVKG